MRILIILSGCCALVLLAYADTQPDKMVSNNTAEAIDSVYVYDFDVADPNGNFSANDTDDQNQTSSDFDSLMMEIGMFTVEFADDFLKMFAGNATQTE